MSDERPFGGLPRGHSGAILADPPWKYVTYSERGQGRSASRHYKVMTYLHSFVGSGCCHERPR